MEILEFKGLYLALNIFTISIPLIRSFEPKINFFSKWKPLFKAIFITGIFFIIWDVIFTVNGVWGFNDKYLLGLNIFSLPIEECLFFITIPYACIFIYEVLNYFIKRDLLHKITQPISWLLMLGSFAMALIFVEKAYTTWNFFFLGFVMLLQLFVIQGKYLGRVYLAYAVGLIGFFAVNGILTGSLIKEEVVWYNAEQFMGIRMGTIPVEDTFYGFTLILLNITLYEFFKLPKNSRTL